MRIFAVLAVSTLCLFSSSFNANCEDAGDEYPKDTPVVSLADSNFDQFLKDNALVFVKFYAPWCNHCKKMVSDYDAAARQLKEMGSDIKVAKLDATVQVKTSEKYDIQSFPTLKFFRDGVPEDFEGGRSKEAILTWLNMMTGPAIEMVKTRDAAERLAMASAVAFIGAFTDEGSPAYKLFHEAADKSRAIGKWIAYLTPDAKNEVTVHRKGDGFVLARALSEVEDLGSFARKERFSYFGEIDGENFNHYAATGADLIWFAGNQKDFEKYGDVMREVGKAIRGQQYVVWLDTERYGSHAEGFLGVNKSPGLVYLYKDARYIYSEPLDSASAEQITDFMKDAQEGKVERHIKSDPIPDTNDEIVKVVVSKSFEEIVLDDTKDVLLEVYAPWCGHCKSLEPKYIRVAEMLEPFEHIVVTKMDGTTNESPIEGFDWSGFPTLFFVKAGAKEPLLYEGDRSEEGIYSFIHKHTTQAIPDFSEVKTAGEGSQDEL